jgi:hypothetical protein
MSNVVSLFKYKKDIAYERLIASMDKLELMEEMVRFQEDRSRLGHLTPLMMVRGICLFGALEKSAETHELMLLTGSYKRHLEFELKDLQKRNISEN